MAARRRRKKTDPETEAPAEVEGQVDTEQPQPDDESREGSPVEQKVEPSVDAPIEATPKVPSSGDVSYVVAPGKSLACLRGIVVAGGVVRLADLNRNKDLAAKSAAGLCARGVLTPTK